MKLQNTGTLKNLTSEFVNAIAKEPDDAFEQLQTLFGRKEMPIPPRLAFEQCLSRLEPIGATLVLPSTFRIASPNVQPIKSNEIDELHSLLAEKSNLSEKRVSEIIEKFYATEELTSKGFVVLLRATVEAPTYSLKSDSLTAIIQHDKYRGDILALALAKSEIGELRELGTKVLPFTNPTLAGSEASRLLKGDTHLSTSDNLFVERTISMWWRYSGADYFDVEDNRGQLSNSEFLAKFEKFADKCFHAEPQLSELARSLSESFLTIDSPDFSNSSFEGLAVIDRSWAEAMRMLATAVRS